MRGFLARPEGDDQHLPLLGEQHITAPIAVLFAQRRNQLCLEPLDRAPRTLTHGINLGNRHTCDHYRLTSRRSSSTIWPSTIRTIRSVARPTPMSCVTIRNVNPRSRFR